MLEDSLGVQQGPWYGTLLLQSKYNNDELIIDGATSSSFKIHAHRGRY